MVGLLAVRNVGGRLLPDAAYVPTNALLAGVLILVARRSDCSWEDLGLDRRHLRRGLAVGAASAAAAISVLSIGAALPATRGFFEDERVDVEAGAGELAYQLLLRIPVGTVLFEEVAFRGVLLVLLLRRFGVRGAVLFGSALFGLWHIVPTLSATSTNDIEGLARAAAVVGAVVVTTLGGMIFSALRLQAGHLLAPVLAHLAINDASYALSWLVQS